MFNFEGERCMDFGGCEAAFPYCTERFKQFYEDNNLTGLKFQPIRCDDVEWPMYLVSFDVINVRFYAGGIPVQSDLPDFYAGISRYFCCNNRIKRLAKKHKLLLSWATVADFQQYGQVATEPFLVE
jgi:hypothetical protein